MSTNSNLWLGFAATLLLPFVPVSQSLAQPAPPEASPGCLQGDPRGTYRGDAPVTRNEFAVGLDRCLNQLTPLLPLDRSNFVTREDMKALIKRQRELNQQLRELSDRVSGIGDRIPGDPDPQTR